MNLEGQQTPKVLKLSEITEKVVTSLAKFIEPYARVIDQANDYDMLTRELSNNIIRENIVEHVSSNIIAAIDRLGTDSSYYEFIRKLVLCSTLTNYTTTMQNILSYFCNKLAKNFDSLQYEPDEFTLLIMMICCDDRSFVSKLPLERRIGFAHGTMKYLCGEDIPDLSPDKMGGNGVVMSILLDSAISGYTMEQLEGILQKYTSGWIRPQWITPYIAELINIVNGSDKETLLHRINENTWRYMMEDKVRNLSIEIRNSKSWNVKVDPSWIRGFIWDILEIFCQFRDDISATGYDQISCEPTGKMIRKLMDSVHHGYQLLEIDKPIVMGDILKCIADIYFIGYPSDGPSRKIISDVIYHFTGSGKWEDGWLEGPYLKALQLAYDKDPIFAEFKELYQMSDSPFEQCLYGFMDKSFESALDLLPATEAKKPERWTYDEDDEEQKEDESPEDENEEPKHRVPGYDIEATQSTKGYDKHSKSVQNGTTKIYKAYKNYKNNEAKVDSQIEKMVSAAKRAFTPDKTEQIISGKRFTPIGLLKKCLLTAGIFSWSKIGGIIYIVVSHTLAKQRTEREKKEILVQLEEEIKLLDEKIDDARGDGNRKAKYALMRTRAELKNARDKIRFNLTATKTDLKTAVNYIKHPARAFDRGGRREDEEY